MKRPKDSSDAFDLELQTLRERNIINSCQSFQDALPQYPTRTSDILIPEDAELCDANHSVTERENEAPSNKRTAYFARPMLPVQLSWTNKKIERVLSNISLKFAGRPLLEQEYSWYYRQLNLPKVCWVALFAAVLVAALGTLSKICEKHKSDGWDSWYWWGVVLIAIAVTVLCGLSFTLYLVGKRKDIHWMWLVLMCAVISSTLCIASTVLHFEDVVDYWSIDSVRARGGETKQALLDELQIQAQRTGTYRVAVEIIFFVVASNFVFRLNFLASMVFTSYSLFLYFGISLGALQRYKDPIACVNELVYITCLLGIVLYVVRVSRKTLRYHWLWLLRQQREVVRKNEEVERLHKSLMPDSTRVQKDARVITAEERVLEMLRELQESVSLSTSQSEKLEEVFELLLKPYAWNMQEELRRINGHDYKGQRIELDHTTNKFLDQMTTSSREQLDDVSGLKRNQSFSQQPHGSNLSSTSMESSNTPGTKGTRAIRSGSGPTNIMTSTSISISTEDGNSGAQRKTIFSSKRSMRDIVMVLGKQRADRAHRRNGSLDMSAVQGDTKQELLVKSRTTGVTPTTTTCSIAAARSKDSRSPYATATHSTSRSSSPATLYSEEVEIVTSEANLTAHIQPAGNGAVLAQSLGFVQGVAEAESNLLSLLGGALSIPRGLKDRHLVGGHELATDWDADIFDICSRVGIHPQLWGREEEQDKGPAEQHVTPSAAVGPLTLVGVLAFTELKFVLQQLSIKPTVLMSFLQLVESNYYPMLDENLMFAPDIDDEKRCGRGNAYHTAWHAADVLRSTLFFLSVGGSGQSTSGAKFSLHGVEQLKEEGVDRNDKELRSVHVTETEACSLGVSLSSETQLRSRLTPLDLFGALIAAGVHDEAALRSGVMDEEIMQEVEAAILYNDHNVLENMHSATAFQLASRSDEVRVFAPLSARDFRYVRKLIVDMVLYTDLRLHFDFVGNFRKQAANNRLMSANCPEKEWPKDCSIVLRMCLKCADLGHAAKPWSQHRRWSLLVQWEFFRQGKTERELDLNLKTPLCDPQDINFPKSQTGFINVLVRPSFEALGLYFGPNSNVARACIKNLEENATTWRSLSKTKPTGFDSPIIDFVRAWKCMNGTFTHLTVLIK